MLNHVLVPRWSFVPGISKQSMEFVAAGEGQIESSERAGNRIRTGPLYLTVHVTLGHTCCFYHFVEHRCSCQFDKPGK